MLQKFRERLINTQRGAIMVFFAILVPLFLGMIGFAVDAGFLYMQKAKLQDIADAAALAGAGHLNDANDSSYTGVTTAVSAFAEANGYKGTGTGNNYVYGSNYTSDDAVTLRANEQWKLAQKVEESVMDKDNVQRNHVRVLMLKRVPTFFIRLLFPEQKSVVVKALAVAEYVKGEAPVVFDRGDAVIMAGQIEFDYQSKDNVDLGNNQSFPIYLGSPVEINKLPGNGNLYCNGVTINGVTIQGVDFDEKKQQPIWNPPMPDRNYIPTGGYAPYWGPESYRNAIKEESDRMNSKYTNLKNTIRTEALNKKAKIDEYISGKDNKRYIGVYNGELIDNIRPEDTEIELYMNGSYAEKFATNWGQKAKEQSVLTNRQLKNVRKVTSLVFETFGVIATEGVTYGKIATIDDNEWYGNSITISGRNNNFTDTISSGSQIWLGGFDNNFTSSNVALLCNSTLHFGKWQSYAERVREGDLVEGGLEFDMATWFDASDDSSWRIHFGGNGSSSSSGGSGSDSSSKSRVRLVI